MCRWPNGDLSFVSAEKEEDAIVMLDEWDNADVAELTQVQNFMVDFPLDRWRRIESSKPLENSHRTTFGTGRIRFLRKPSRAHVRPAQATSAHPAQRSAQLSRPRGCDSKARNKQNSRTRNLGKSIQSQLGASAALINRHVKNVAIEVLKKSATSRRKQ